MKNYFAQILLLTVLSGIFSFLLSGKKCENLFRYLAALCLLLALFSPVKSIFTENFSFYFPEGSDETTDYSAYIEGVENEASSRLSENYSKYIETETHLSKEDFFLKIEIECIEKDFAIEKITVELYTVSAVIHRDQIDTCLSELRKEVIYIEKLS